MACAHFKSLTDQTDASTMAGRFFFHVIVSLAQIERDLTVDLNTVLPLARRLEYELPMKL